jgi:hypothetical protein
MRRPGPAGMAPEKIDVKRADQDRANAEKIRLLKELAKQTKPVADSKGVKGKVDE